MAPCPGLEDAGHIVVSSDLVDRGYGENRIDFLMELASRAPNVVTNPPFKLAIPFVRQSLALTTGKVAMLFKLAFLEGQERAAMFRETPLARVWIFSRRLAFSGANAPAKKDADSGGMMAFAWFVWDHAYPREKWGTFTGGWVP